MRGAAHAIGWELTRRHRLGLVVLAAYLIGFALVKRFVLGPEAQLRFDPPNGLAAFVVVPLTITFFFFVGGFSYGLSGDLAARESAFPKRMFQLPVSTLELVGWPMLFGTVASIALWIAAVLLVWSSGGVKGAQPPLVWPALAIAAFLAWMQALTWLAYPMRGMRLVVAILVLLASDITVVVAIELRAREATMVAILAPQIVAAYLIGYLGVRRARCGEVPDWAPAYAGATRQAAGATRQAAGATRQGAGATKQAAGATKALFKSPARAQVWLEWQRHGRTLPTMVFWVVPFELLLLFLPGNDGAGMVFFIVFVVLVTPPFLAMMAAPALSALSTYAATRPMTSVQLVRAKLAMTLWSTAAAWAVVTVFTVIGLHLSDTLPIVVGKLRGFAEVSGAPRAVVVSVLVVAWAILSTWKNLVQSLCIGLTGNPWIVKTSLVAALVLLSLFFPAVWIVVRNDTVQAFVWDFMAWMLAALVLLKVFAAAWVMVRLHDGGVMEGGAIVKAAALWLVAVILVYGLLAWIADSPIFPFYFVAAFAIFTVPVARLSAAPLALAASRHR